MTHPPPRSYEKHTASALALPVSQTLPVLAILLPFLGILNAALPFLLAAAQRGLRGHRPRLRPALSATPVADILVPTLSVRALQLAQLVLAVVLATGFFANAAPSDVRTCLVGTTWQRMFASKDAATLRRIQDAFNCCGLNSVRDRAWPFAEDLAGGIGGAPCADRFGRTQSCAAPWTAALQSMGHTEGVVAVLVAVLQVVLYLYEMVRWVMAGPSAEEGAEEEAVVVSRTATTVSTWPRLLAMQFGGSGAGSSVDNQDGDADESASRPLLDGSGGGGGGDSAGVAGAESDAGAGSHGGNNRGGPMEGRSNGNYGTGGASSAGADDFHGGNAWGDAD